MEKEFNQKQRRLLNILAICSDIGCEKEICLTTKLIYVMILISCDKKGICKKRNSTFAKKINLNKGQVSRHIKKLNELGIISHKRKNKYFRMIKFNKSVAHAQQKILKRLQKLNEYIGLKNFEEINKFYNL